MSALRKTRASAWCPDAISRSDLSGSNTIKVVRAARVADVGIPWDAAIAIPARNEEQRIVRCLAALRAAIVAVGRPVGIVLVVNNSHDATYDRAERWLSQANVPHMLLDVDFADSWAFVGSARRLSLDLAAEAIEREGLLFTTDADSVVDRHWIMDGFREIGDRADLVCGTILRLDDEQTRVPADVAQRCAPESAYVALSVELAARLDPRPHDPLPAHWNAGGANLVFARSVYEAVGGMPVLVSGEDRAFVAEAERHDLRVVYAPNVLVRTSCRLTGRASGGLADALRSWIADEDPVCDDRLFHAVASGRRFWLRGRLRRLGHGAAGEALLATLGLAPQVARRRNGEAFGTFWDRIDACCFRSKQVRLRMSDVVRELPALSAIVARLKAGERPQDDVRQAGAWFAACAEGGP